MDDVETLAKDWHDDDGTMLILMVAEASLQKVVGRLQLKNYLVQVLRLLKHLLLYYSRVSNCLTESMALERSKIIKK